MKPASTLTGRVATPAFAVSAMLAALLLAGCGGGGSSSPASTPFPVANDPSTTDFMSHWNMCAKPRTGVDAHGQAYPDKQGTLLDELTFLKGWSDQYYLWYKEIPTTYRMADFTNAIDYFDRLKTTALTASGKPKDKFHFTYPTAEWDAMTTAGEDVGYGVTWSSTSSTAPRTWTAAEVEPGSPAAAAGMKRGDVLTVVDGYDFVNSNTSTAIDAINAGLFPAASGEQHKLTVHRAGTYADIPITMTSAVVSSDSVKNVRVLDTPTGKVGYLTFDTHNAVAEQQLIDAFNQFKTAGVSDLVLDMRYNGGGLLYLASELGYMIAGPSSTGKVFERLVFNDKTKPEDPILFPATAYGFDAPHPATAGTALPYLGLNRVTVLTTSGTCSASEVVINALRGVGVQANLIGGQTCGKPYGFTPVPNCGTTYFSIEFQGVNAQGFGDFADGMAPTCNVSDDFTHDMGDPAEGMLSAALNYRTANACASSATGAITAHAMAASRAMSVPGTLVRPQAKEVAIYMKPR